MTDDADFILTVNDLIECGFCATGQMRWFRTHNIDFKEHLARGTRASVVLATEDAMAIRAVEILRERRRG